MKLPVTVAAATLKQIGTDEVDAFIEDFLALTVEDAASLALDLWEFNRDNEGRPERAIRTRRPASANGGELLR